MAKDKQIKELVDGLNVDLAAEYAAVIQYRTYASAVSGPYRQDLRAFFTAEIADELGHAQLLCDKIVSLGGTPVMQAGPTKMTEDARQMLENALADEIETIGRYVKRRRQAEECEEFGLAVALDALIADETGHRDELRQMLKRWS